MANKGSWRSPGRWCALRAEFERSGLSVKAFCRQQLINTSNFYRWRHLLAGGETVVKGWATGFLELGTLTQPPKSSVSLTLTLTLDLDLGDGLILRLIRHH